MIVQLQEISTGATFGIGNVHLPAKPSNVLGRLKTMSNTIQKLACYDPPRRKSPLDGLLLIAGDFNCDAYSVTGRLLSTGKSSYGNLHDRNYKANLSKASASQMRHHYRFQNIYDGPINNDNNSNNKNLQTLRETYAPVTVSLHGRGPGCMDQLYFTQFPTAPKRRNNNNDPDSINTILSPSRKSMGKRKKRRDKASRTRSQERNLQNYRSNGFVATNVRVDSVLATIAGPHDTQRLQVINDGLPNVQEGFPSDHIPIGGLFVGNRDTNGTYSTRDGDETLSSSSTAAAAAAGYNEKEMGNHKDQSPVPGSRSLGSGGGVKASVRKRRQTHQESVLIRRRHNLVLQCVADWLEGRGATKIIRDQPLYKNLFLLEKLGDKSLTKKSRAPDLVCCLGNINGADGDDDGFVAVLEVTVSAKPENARAQKLDKYQDLCQRLPKLPLENKDALFVIVVEEHGTIPEETRRDLETLAALSTNDEEDAKKEAQRFCNYLQAMITAT